MSTDLEKGQARAQAEEEIGSAYRYVYLGVYATAVAAGLVSVVGLWQPSGNTIANTAGLLVVALFMFTNADAFVTYWELRTATLKIRRENEKFSRSLKSEREHLEKLKRARHALERFEKVKCKKISVMSEEVTEMAVNNEQELSRTIGRLLLYAAADKGDRAAPIREGEQLEHAIKIFSELFVRVHPKFQERVDLMHAEMRKSQDFREKGVEMKRLTKMMVACILAEKTATIPTLVGRIFLEDEEKLRESVCVEKEVAQNLARGLEVFKKEASEEGLV